MRLSQVEAILGKDYDEETEGEGEENCVWKKGAVEVYIWFGDNAASPGGEPVVTEFFFEPSTPTSPGVLDRLRAWLGL
jgi:hypothetical protein